MAETEIKTKMCSHCKRELPVEMFHKSSTSKDGYQYICKVCGNELAKESYERKKSKIKEANFLAKLSTQDTTNTITLKDGTVLKKKEKKEEPVTAQATTLSLSDFSTASIIKELKDRGFMWDHLWTKHEIDWNKV